MIDAICHIASQFFAPYLWCYYIFIGLSVAATIVSAYAFALYAISIFSE